MVDLLWEKIVTGYIHQLDKRPWFTVILDLIETVRARPDAAALRPDKADSRLYLHFLNSNDLFMVISPVLHLPENFMVVDLVTFQGATVESHDLISTVSRMLDDIQVYIQQWRLP